MIGWILKKIIGTQNERMLRRVRPLVEKINAFEPAMEKLTDDEAGARGLSWEIINGVAPLTLASKGDGPTLRKFMANAGTRLETALGFLEKPHAHLKPKIFRRERAYRTNVHGIQRVIVIKNPARIRGECAVTAAIDDTERIVAHDIACEPDAARAKDAAFIIEHDARAEINSLGLVNLRFNETALRFPVIDGIFLQLAFAGLIANRAIERMIDEQEFEHAFTHGLHTGRVRVNFHPG